ncbi:hypothetical protein PRIPAC_76977 [Pristionchus pacificus]|uniref:Adipocyte plasma membrane-associated protein n=1 Tax=Pristionchus pacificus TaxID=54126 RepID=A0A2A6C383_PRIPA|nr:hypothetical protein PRIPAC_76977 [Pristionchus pacificus]|eukprot:PDM72692.1 hypothetical protein PRIPAC_39126 [Pristionchus pacificus]
MPDYSAVAYTLPPPPSLTGPLQPNDALTKVEYLLKDEIKGPESLVVDGDTIYTGVHDGRLLKIVGGKIVKEIRLGDTQRQFGGYEDEIHLGRPLGIRKMEGEKMIIADAYLGVFIADFENGSKQKVFDSKIPLDGEVAMFLNDIDLISNDEIVFTDSSLLYARKDSMRDILGARGTGRAIYHRISTGESKVLMRGLHFANGIQVMPDGVSFIVAEMTRARILRYYFDGSKKGKTETFIENLPGMPDNIRLSSGGRSVWVALAGVRCAGKSNGLERLAKSPKLRQVIRAILPNHFLREVLPSLAPKETIVVEIDLNGKIVSSLHDEKGEKMKDISQISDSGEYLYFGSFKAPYKARLKKDLI